MAWIEHSHRKEGLFDQSLLPWIAKILPEFSEEELRAAWRASRDDDALKRYARGKERDTPQFAGIEAAYIVAVLLRGIYHEYWGKTRVEPVQVMHHRLRLLTLPATRRAASGEFTPSTTLKFLSNIILASAFEERRHEARIALWAENVRAARAAHFNDVIDLLDPLDEETALRRAADAAGMMQIRTWGTTFERALDNLVGLGVGGLTSFVLRSWEGFAVGETARRITHPGRRIARLVKGRVRLLEELAESGPGRIEGTWLRLGG